MSSGEDHVAEQAVAKALLQYALNSVSNPALEEKCTRHYLDEMRLLSFFSVDYVLGLKSVSSPHFAAVRELYNAEIERLCESKEPPFTLNTIMERFETYSEACNAGALAQREPKGEPMAFWELGKAISQKASDADPWVPSALEVVHHANIFIKEVLRLTQFLDKAARA
jgi:hypothetical protein